MAGRQDLDAILDTLREVEASLERRVARAEGANMMVWALAVASIFAFYQLVEWNHAPYHAALGRALPWVWLGPIAAGFVLSSVIGARVGRITRGRDARWALLHAVVPSVVATALAALLVWTTRYELVYGAVPAVCGAATLAFAWPRPPGAFRAWARLVGAGMLLVGGALMAWPTESAPLVASLTFLLGLGGLGAARYRLGG